MYFPISGVEVSPFVPPLIALGVSFFASMGGISGAFLLLPFQMSVLGYTNPSVSGTNHFYNIVAIPSGVYRYVKEKRMVWPLTAEIVSIGGRLDAERRLQRHVAVLARGDDIFPHVFAALGDRVNVVTR